MFLYGWFKETFVLNYYHSYISLCSAFWITAEKPLELYNIFSVSLSFGKDGGAEILSSSY